MPAARRPWAGKALQGKSMSQKVVLKATKREVIGKQVGALRRSGKLPAVLYGHKIKSIPIVLDPVEVFRSMAHRPHPAW